MHLRAYFFAATVDDRERAALGSDRRIQLDRNVDVRCRSNPRALRPECTRPLVNAPHHLSHIASNFEVGRQPCRAYWDMSGLRLSLDAADDCNERDEKYECRRDDPHEPSTCRVCTARPGPRGF